MNSNFRPGRSPDRKLPSLQRLPSYPCCPPHFGGNRTAAGSVPDTHQKKPRREAGGSPVVQNRVVQYLAVTGPLPQLKRADQFGAYGLHARPIALCKSGRTDDAAERRRRAIDRVGSRVVFGPAILVLPEQAGQPAERIFGAAADEPASVGAAGQLQAGRPSEAGKSALT